MNLNKKRNYLFIAAFFMALLCMFAYAKPAAAAVTTIKDGETLKVKNFNSSGDASTYATEAVDGTKLYNFSVSKAGTLTLDYAYLETTYPLVRIYNASGSEVTSVNYERSTKVLDSGQTATEYFRYYYLAKGSYKVYVDPYTSSGTTYPVLLQLKFAPASGKVKSGKIFYGGSQSSSSFSYYKVTAKKTGYLNVQLGDATGLSSYPSFDVKLMTAKKKKITSEETVGSSQGYQTNFAVKKGTYYIAVKSRSSHPVFGIKVTAKAVSVSKSGASKKKAAAIKKGSTVKGLIFASKKKNSGTKWYKIIVPKTQKVSITVRTKPSQGGTNGKLKLTCVNKYGKTVEDTFYYYRTGATLEYYSSYSTKKLDKGTYWLGVSGENYGSGYYTLKWDK